MKKIYTNLIVFVIIAVIAIAVLVFAYPIIAVYLSSNQVNIDPNKATLKIVTCDVSVKNPVGIPIFKGGDLTIESINCQQQPVAYCGSFGVFSDKGQLRISGAGGFGQGVDVDVSEGSSSQYIVKWCGATRNNDVTVSLLNEDGGKLYDKVVHLT